MQQSANNWLWCWTKFFCVLFIFTCSSTSIIRSGSFWITFTVYLNMQLYHKIYIVDYFNVFRWRLFDLGGNHLCADIYFHTPFGCGDNISLLRNWITSYKIRMIWNFMTSYWVKQITHCDDSVLLYSLIYILKHITLLLLT